MARLIVFDLDGTLVDSRRDLAESANLLLTEIGCKPLPEDVIGGMVGEGAATLVARVLEASLCAPPPADALGRFLAIYNSRLLKFTRAYPGVPEALTALGARAHLAVLTNKPLEATHEILTALDLARYFPPARVLGGDGPLARKPDPAGLLHLMREAAATPSETTMVGDSVIDFRTARAAGTHLCLVRYGFGFGGFLAGDLSPEDHVVDAPPGLVSAL